MADAFDTASKLEALHTAASLAAAGTRPGRGPLWADGIPYCRECGERCPPQGFTYLVPIYFSLRLISRQEAFQRVPAV